MVVLGLSAKHKNSPPQQTDAGSAGKSDGDESSVSAVQPGVQPGVQPDVKPGVRPEVHARQDDSQHHYGIELTNRTFCAIQRHVLTGESFNDLADQVDEIKAGLQVVPGPPELVQIANEIGSVLASFEDRVRESSRETAVDFQKVLSLLSENFSCMQAGDDKAEQRLRYFERGLSEATKMDSLVSLRRHLSGMLEYARTQGRLDVAEKETRLRSVTEQLHHAQAASSRLRVQMPGRTEALGHIKALQDACTGKLEGNAGLFVVDSLTAVRGRHGEEIASNILEELGRKEIQPLEQDGKVFCWSHSSLVLISQPKTGIASAGLLHAVPSMFEHRAFIGTRVATFKVKIRSISTPLARGVDEVTATLDRFCREMAA